MRQSYQKADDWLAYMFGWDEDYREEAREHEEKMTYYNSQAANKQLAANNKRNDPKQLDVHRLHPHEAMRAVNQRMSQVDELKIITGYGRHSRGGTAKVKPAIEKCLRAKGYKVNADHRNPGRVIASRWSNGLRNASTGGEGRSNSWWSQTSWW